MKTLIFGFKFTRSLFFIFLIKITYLFQILSKLSDKEPFIANLTNSNVRRGYTVHYTLLIQPLKLMTTHSLPGHIWQNLELKQGISVGLP